MTGGLSVGVGGAKRLNRLRNDIALFEVMMETNGFRPNNELREMGATFRVWVLTDAFMIRIGSKIAPNEKIRTSLQYP